MKWPRPNHQPTASAARLVAVPSTCQTSAQSATKSAGTNPTGGKASTEARPNAQAVSQRRHPVSAARAAARRTRRREPRAAVAVKPSRWAGGISAAA